MRLSLILLTISGWGLFKQIDVQYGRQSNVLQIFADGHITKPPHLSIWFQQRDLFSESKYADRIKSAEDPDQLACRFLADISVGEILWKISVFSFALM
jgi:hypothetical protein